MNEEQIMSQSRTLKLLSGMQTIFYGQFRAAVLLFGVIITCYFAAPAEGNEQFQGIKPFQPGEVLTYKGAWGKIPAGELKMEVLPGTKLDGIDVHHFVMTTKTNPQVDLIYKIRDRQESYVDSAMTCSLLYKKKTISKHPRDVRINFDWKNMKATYSNFGKAGMPIGILPGSFDPLALFYVIRMQSLKENSAFNILLTDGKQFMKVLVHVGKKSRVKIGKRTYDIFEVTPDMSAFDQIKEKASFSDQSQIKVWITDDEKKIPVKIRSKVGIISFDFDFIPESSSVQ